MDRRDGRYTMNDGRYTMNDVGVIPNYQIPESNRITGESMMCIRGMNRVESYHKSKKKKKSKIARKSRQRNRNK